MDASESQNQMQPPRKHPKTQGDLHVEVLELEKEKMLVGKENLFIHRKKLELQVELLQREVDGK